MTDVFEKVLRARTTWQALPVWSVLRPVQESGFPDLPLLSLYRDHGVVPKDSRDDNFNQSGADLSVYLRVLPGDVVVNKMKAWQGSIAVSEHTGIVSPDYEVLRIHRPNILSRYLHYLLRSQPYIDEYRRRSYGVRPSQWRLMYEDLRTLPLLVPPPTEQRALVEHLDNEASALDAIAEWRLSQLSLHGDLVLGLVATGPNQPLLKRCSIPWLRMMPANWSEVRARFLFRQVSRPVRDTDGVVTAFRDGQVTLRTNRRTEGFTEAVLEQGYQGVRAGDLVLHSMDAFAGAIGVSESDGKCTPEYVVCEPINGDIDVHYYSAVLRLMARRDYIRVICPSVRERAPRFRFSTFRDVVLPVPPPVEQSELGNLVRASSSMTRHVQSELELLLEYRRALISRAVFGRAREAA